LESKFYIPPPLSKGDFGLDGVIGGFFIVG